MVKLQEVGPAMVIIKDVVKIKCKGVGTRLIQNRRQTHNFKF